MAYASAAGGRGNNGGAGGKGDNAGTTTFFITVTGNNPQPSSFTLGEGVLILLLLPRRRGEDELGDGNNTFTPL
jgi:hypothetical protein